MILELFYRLITLESVEQIIKFASEIMWGVPLIVLLVGTHVYLTIRLRFPQRYLWKAIKLSFAKEKGSKGDVSAYGALFTALAATIGTGNIVGVSTAVALGGPGAVFWCWLTGVFGIATKYSEALLAVKFRVKTEKGEMPINSVLMCWGQLMSFHPAWNVLRDSGSHFSTAPGKMKNQGIYALTPI